MAAGVNQGLLIRKGLLLAKEEVTAGVDALPVATLDAIQAFNAEFSVDPNVLEREILTGDISPVESVIGRKLSSVSFTVEMKSNGLFDGDVVASEPKLARLLKGCGYLLSGRPDRATSFTTDFATNNDLTMPASMGADHGLQTGDGVVQVYANGGTLPTGLAAATDYFVIRKSGTAFALAISKANAIAGTEVVLSVADAIGTVQVDLLTATLVNPDPSNNAAGVLDVITRGKAATTPVNNAFTAPILYTVEVTTPGASGVAQILITGNNDLVDDTSANVPAVVTSDTPFELAGATGSDVFLNFEFTSDLVLGDKWRVMVHPDGIVASPVSENFDCLTIKFFEDGLLYTLLGAQGTFTADATAGEFGTLEFTFTGQFVPVADAATPTNAVFETTLPQQVELGLLTWGSNVNLVVEEWTFDQANNVVPRPDVNKSDGFQGVRITDRVPVGGFNPEATLVVNEDFWGDFSTALAKVFTSRVGTSQGNQVMIYAPRAQTSEIAFGDRDGVRSFDHTIGFKRLNGNDESDWYFM